jgi:hypothetical protein
VEALVLVGIDGYSRTLICVWCEVALACKAARKKCTAVCGFIHSIELLDLQRWFTTLKERRRSLIGLKAVIEEQYEKEWKR